MAIDLPRKRLAGKTGKWSASAKRVLEERYLWRDESGQLVEDPDSMCWRVASAIAEAERKWGHEPADIAEQFCLMLLERKFMPNSPTLMNAGKGNDLQLSACFVLPVDDSLEGIFESVKHAALVHQSGGGTGFAFSRLRPEGSLVRSTRGVASGPVSFMKIFNEATDAVKQGGTRRGANMGILRVDHPDILKFIDCKRTGGITNFNISVAATDAFMRAVHADADYDLINPQDGRVVGSLPACQVFDRIAEAAWASGDPGMIFIDRINSSPANPTPEVGLVEATNPCGEQPLLPYEACNLGSINLAELVVERDGRRTLDWEELDRIVRLSIRFLDDVIEVNPYPLPQIHEMVKANRRVGLGVMGWADLLFKLGIPYDSEEALRLADEVMERINRGAHRATEELAVERGPFPNWSRSIYRDGRPMRNSTVTTIAPTGTISIIADCSSGIEPIFALAYVHKSGDRLLRFVNPIFVETARARGFYSDELMQDVLFHGSVHGVKGVPEDAQRVFVTAHEIAPDWHVRMQAAFQRHTDNAVSKCIAAGTLLPTSHGLIPIERFSDNEADDSFVSLDGSIRTGGHRIVAHYRAGVKPATRVRLDSGASIVAATESHRLLTTDGWKVMRDLRPGDVVIGRFQEAHGPGGAPLTWESVYQTNARRLPIPAAMTCELAEMLGMLCADGHVVESSGQVGLSCADDAVEGRFKDLCQRLFDVTPNVAEDGRTGVRCVYLTSRNLARFVASLIGQGAYDKRAPDAILAGSAEEKLAFLRGITLDGYLTSDHGLCVYAGMSETLAYHVAEICRSFGVPKVWQGTRPVAGASRAAAEAHVVFVSGDMQRKIRCIERHKNAAEPADVAYKVLLDRRRLDEQVGIDQPHYSAIRALRQDKERQYCTSRLAAALGWPTDTPVYLVTAVEDAGLVDLYDVEVEDAHEYVVNGVVSHNTINLPKDASVDDVRHAYLLSYELGCLGITVFRDGCKGEQVLNVGVAEKKPEAEAEPAPPVIEAKVKERPAVVFGYTTQIQAPEGKLNVTLNSDETGLLEVFINVGKAGSDLAALAEAMGRLISLNLRLPSPMSADDRVREIIDQLRGIGGSRSVGFGQSQVRSLPDAISKVLERHMLDHPSPEKLKAAEEQPPLPGLLHTGNLCPRCGCSTLVFEEGCKKCYSCSYSEC